jgi:lysophospholipase L1-like esterase
MPYDVQSHGVDLCIVQFGLNDCNHWATDGGLPRVSPAAFAANLHEIAARARAFGARHVVFNTNHPTLRDVEVMAGASVTFESQNRCYNEIIRRVASEAPPWVLLHDVEAYWLDYIERTDVHLDALLLEDGLHLSEAGHDLYFDVTWPMVEEIVAREFGGRSE